MQVKFKQWNCKVVFGKYHNGNTTIQLVADEFDEFPGEPIATASVNLEDGVVGEGKVAIKDYSENEGMLDVMIEAGIVSTPVRLEMRGFVTIPICKLLKET